MPHMQRRHLIGLSFLVILSFSAVVYTVFISEGWEKRESLQQEVATRNFENDAAQKEVEKLRERIQAIRERPGVREWPCLLYTSPSPRDATLSRMPSSA